MKITGIIMTASNIEALKAKRKRQTRRIYKPKPGFPKEDGEITPTSMDSWTDYGPCPYGGPGDVLWVREAFFDVHKWKHTPKFAAVGPDYLYRADYDYRGKKGRAEILGCHRWKSPRFMPRSAARLWLMIEDVRLQRVQEISEEDALAEGILKTGDLFVHGGCVIGRDNAGGVAGDAVTAYSELWESIHGAGAWAKNQWVWALTFREMAKDEVERLAA